MKRILHLLFLAVALSPVTGSPLEGQIKNPQLGTIDVISYQFFIRLQDTTDIVTGNTSVEVLYKMDTDHCTLDLVGRAEDGKGMEVESILVAGVPVDFVHQNDRIILRDPGARKGEVRTYEIRYRGIPRTGLIISRNKFGDRTFFGDNWPNRARHWLPVVDHPSDKALVSFRVDAPWHYSVVANGALKEEWRVAGRVHSHWATKVPLPTKLMVIGVSPFAIEYMTSASGVPVSSWVFPQNREEGFHDYEVAVKILSFFESCIAPYPYEKLANVQSKTDYGGMENASCIFYNESTVTGRQDNEHTLAHEIAHQWYGDAVSELDWHHVWLSEGFATYLEALYVEFECGRDSFENKMLDSKRKVIRYARRNFAPVVDTTLSLSARRLLNTNVYDKGAWFLHMLRHEIGDDLFWQCLRDFYHTFEFGNALTEDFQQVAEKVSGKDMNHYFKQWLYTPGHPVLNVEWAIKDSDLSITVRQIQEQALFEFPLDVAALCRDGKVVRETIRISGRTKTFTLRNCSNVEDLRIDPDTWLLFELAQTQN